jgi:hypothetical protein
MDFDFNYWVNLHQNNPEEFEEKRANIIEAFIEDSKTCKHRLNGLQFKIDMERRKSKTSMKACIVMSNLLMEKFYDEFSPAVNKLNLPIK